MDGLENDATLVSDTLASPEVAGELGKNETFISENERQEVEQEIKELADDLRKATKQTSNYSELVESLVRMSKQPTFDFHLVNEGNTNNQNPLHIGHYLFGVCCDFLDELDKLTQTNNHDELFGMLEDLERQDMLSRASSLCFLLFVNDQDFLFKYGNTFYQELPEMINKLEQIVQQEESQISELISLYRSWGPLCETAIPPVISLICYLEDGEVHFDKSEEMSLKDSVDHIESFRLLSQVGSRLNVDLRNAVSHGGKNAGYNHNPLTGEIKMWYLEGQERQVKSFSVEEFHQVVIETLAAVVTLFLVPLYLVAGHACIEITSAVE